MEIAKDIAEITSTEAPPPPLTIADSPLELAERSEKSDPETGPDNSIMVPDETQVGSPSLTEGESSPGKSAATSEEIASELRHVTPPTEQAPDFGEQNASTEALPPVKELAARKDDHFDINKTTITITLQFLRLTSEDELDRDMNIGIRKKDGPPVLRKTALREPLGLKERLSQQGILLCASLSSFASSRTARQPGERRPPKENVLRRARPAQLPILDDQYPGSSRNR